MATPIHATPRPVLNGAKVRELRYHRGLTAVQLAQRAGVSGQHMYRLEVGAYRGRPQTIKAIADALGVTVADITKSSADTGTG